MIGRRRAALGARPDRHRGPVDGAIVDDDELEAGPAGGVPVVLPGDVGHEQGSTPASSRPATTTLNVGGGAVGSIGGGSGGIGGRRLAAMIGTSPPMTTAIEPATSQRAPPPAAAAAAEQEAADERRQRGRPPGDRRRRRVPGAVDDVFGGSFEDVLGVTFLRAFRLG